MNVIIVGAGGHGKVVLDILRHDIDAKYVAFVDDDTSLHQAVIDGAPVLGGISSLPSLISRYHLDNAVIAIGDNRVRAGLFGKLKKLGLRLGNAIHPDALIAKDVEIGEGVVIAAGVIINTGCRIGDNVIINTGVIIDYNSIIEDHTHISPGVRLGSAVVVKRYSHVGLGAVAVPEIVIGEDVTIGAGAVALASVPDATLAVGVPARVIKNKAAHRAEKRS